MFRVWSFARVNGFLDVALPYRSGHRSAERLTRRGNLGLIAGSARGKPVHLYTNIPALITEINIQLDDLVSCLTARGKTRPGKHIGGTRCEDAQRFQRKRQ